ncbi:hypothetical protein B6U91_02000 [Candidatus Pacearchaeota archaeon ex4484_71]|nr:MAG: hypothetical protein B6U91_02000 [Candidatus Pacearchaeota archaeon ex4484_71]
MIKRMRSDSVNFGLAGGIVVAFLMLLMNLAYQFWGLFPESLSLVQDIYGFVGYDLTWFGVLLGTIYAFFDGFVAFWLFALVYNGLRE